MGSTRGRWRDAGVFGAARVPAEPATGASEAEICSPGIISTGSCWRMRVDRRSSGIPRSGDLRTGPRDAHGPWRDHHRKGLPAGAPGLRDREVFVLPCGTIPAMRRWILARRWRRGARCPGQNRRVRRQRALPRDDRGERQRRPGTGTFSVSGPRAKAVQPLGGGLWWFRDGSVRKWPGRDPRAAPSRSRQ